MADKEQVPLVGAGPQQRPQMVQIVAPPNPSAPVQYPQVVGPPYASSPLIRVLKDLVAYRQSLVVVLAPILFLPLLFVGKSEATCGYCVIVMGLYWMFEVMPLAVTALMPIFLFPMLGILGTKEVCPKYLPDVNFLFIGGLIIAVAVEKCGLHKRIALRVLTIVGSEPKWIMLGFMSVTAFLSMWISNTATTAMMVPIAKSVVVTLLKSKDKRRASNKDEELALLERERLYPNVEPANRQEAAKEQKEEEDEEIRMEKLSPEERNIAKALMICIAFAANIGGTGTITGTPPNLVAVGLLGQMFPGADTGTSYANWMLFAIPGMLVAVALCWLTLVVYFLGFRSLLAICRRNSGPKQDDSVSQLMKANYRALPPMKFAEKMVLILFSILLLMWIFRDPKQFPGFGALFKEK